MPIWAALEVSATPSGREHVWELHNTTAQDTAALRRFSAYVGQARTFYRAAMTMEVLSRPLASYYSLLNLAKAWLTMVDPDTTDGALFHGAGDANQLKTRYRFTQERLKVGQNGILREIAKRSGSGFAYPANRVLVVTQLVKYLCETYEDYENSIGNFPGLLPLSSLEVLRGKAEIDGKLTGALWLRGEIDKGLLRARKLSSGSLFQVAKHFGDVFKPVTSKKTTLSFESEPVAYGRNTTYAFPGLAEQYEKSLLHTNRTVGDSRYSVVLSNRDELLSQEAVTFAVMLHLSNMVRYRPEHVEKLAGERWSWLLSTWVPRALENALLTYGTRITRTEMRVTCPG